MNHSENTSDQGETAPIESSDPSCEEGERSGSRRSITIWSAALAALALLLLWILTSMDLIRLGRSGSGSVSLAGSEGAALEYSFGGLTEDALYYFRIWPEHDEWRGMTIEGSFVTDHLGKQKVAWSDSNEYEVRYGNDEAGWSAWSIPSALVDPYRESTESEALIALGVDTDTLVEIRPTQERSAVPSDYLRVESGDEALVYLLWPRWNHQLKREGESEWRPVRMIKFDTLGMSFSEVDLLCLSESDCVWGRRNAHGQGSLLRQQQNDLGNSCTLRT